MTQARATSAGIVAILLWGSAIAVSRSLAERLGVLTAAAAVFLAGGVLACLPLAASPRARRAVRGLPRPYWLACGALFTSYMICLYLAVGLARGRAEVVGVGMVNYLWPSLTLALSVPILGRSARWTLLPGLLIATAGVVLALASAGPVTVRSLLASLRADAACLLLALGAAATWGLYSNLCRRLAPGGEGSGVPLFLLATGIVLAALRAGFREESEWTGRALLELAFTAVFPTFLAYRLWETALRAGDHALVASASYAIPVLSTVATCLYLGIPMGGALWVAAALVAGGALLCRASITSDCRSRSKDAPPDP